MSPRRPRCRRPPPPRPATASTSSPAARPRTRAACEPWPDAGAPHRLDARTHARTRPRPTPQGGGEAGADRPPHAVWSARTPAPNFELRGDKIARSVPSAWVTAKRPKPDRAQPRPHTVRAIPRISSPCAPRVPRTRAPSRARVPPKVTERGSFRGRGRVCTHNSAVAGASILRNPRPIPRTAR